MVMSKEKINNFKLTKIDFLPFIEGLDLFLSLSIITYISSYLFPGIDFRVSIIYSTILILLSFVSKLVSPYFLNKLKFLTNLSKYFFLIFSSIYLLPIILPSQNLFYIPVIILILFRLSVGIFFSIFNPIILRNNSLNQIFNNDSVVKYWLIFITGMIFGSIFFSIVNEALSNNVLNLGGWKIFYLIIFLIIFFIFIFDKFFSKSNHFLSNFSFTDDISVSFKDLNIVAKNFSIIIPIFFFIIFASSSWLPKFCNPENMQLLDYKIMFLILIFLFTIFLFPLLKLIGKKRSSFFVTVLLLSISILPIFVVDHSSYSINFIKFLISLISGLSLCIFLLDYKIKQNLSSNEIFFSLNFPFFLVFLLVPFSFYYFIHNTLSNNIIFVIFSSIFLVCLLSRIYSKRK